MEIKVVRDAMQDVSDTSGGQDTGAVALEQIRSRGYADKYLGQKGVRVLELGLVFSMAQRNLLQFAGAEWG
jgi:hypothetical protein